MEVHSGKAVLVHTCTLAKKWKNGSYLQEVDFMRYKLYLNKGFWKMHTILRNLSGKVKQVIVKEVI